MPRQLFQNAKSTVWQLNTWSLVAAVYGSVLCTKPQIDSLSQTLRDYYWAKVEERKSKLNSAVFPDPWTWVVKTFVVFYERDPGGDVSAAMLIDGGEPNVLQAVGIGLPGVPP